MTTKQITRIISSFFAGIWVIRYLKPSLFGKFSYVLAFSSIFSGIAKLGLATIVVQKSRWFGT